MAKMQRIVEKTRIISLYGIAIILGSLLGFISTNKNQDSGPFHYGVGIGDTAHADAAGCGGCSSANNGGGSNSAPIDAGSGSSMGSCGGCGGGGGTGGSGSGGTGGSGGGGGE